MDTSEIEVLFARTLVGDYDGEDAWAAVHALRKNGSRGIFEYAAAWCVSDDPLKRSRGSDVLCQLMRSPMTDGTEWMYRDESYVLITKMLDGERDSYVILSAIHALGHLDNPHAIPLILSYQDHTDEDVRYAVACALGCFANDPQSVEGLLKLTSDADADVRDWAVFGVGVQGDVDSPEIRDVLLRCLDDENGNVREEAAVGLGKRHEQRLLPKLFRMFDDPKHTDRVYEAAASLLGLDREPQDWTTENYKVALTERFPSAG